MARKSPIMIILSLLMIALVITIPLASMSAVFWTTSNYQGPKAQFYILEGYDDYDGKKKIIALASEGMGTAFDVDPDDEAHGLPNLRASQTDIFIPEVRQFDIPDWVPSSWIPTTVDNPIKVYSWDYDNGDGTTSRYIIQEWLAYLYVTITADPEGSADSWGSPPDETQYRYRHWKLWFYVDMGNGHWYFDNATNAYFAIGKIMLKDIIIKGHLVDDVRVSPSVPNTPVAFKSYRPFDPYEWKGHKLNPDIFADHALFYITLDDFGVQAWKDHWWSKWSWEGDQVTMVFEVHIFAVGEWVVQNTEEAPDPGDYSDIQESRHNVWFNWDVSSWPWWMKVLIPVGILGAVLLLTPIDEILLLGALGWIAGRKRK